MPNNAEVYRSLPKFAEDADREKNFSHTKGYGWSITSVTNITAEIIAEITRCKAIFYLLLREKIRCNIASEFVTLCNTILSRLEICNIV